tara:strand:- start:33 stop:491 length:459 start_codon:yes stop_codon:yes gene_type:complete
METKIECPVCRSKNCFESVEKDVTSYLCLRCGYTSNSLLKQDSKSLEEVMNTTPQLAKDLQIYDYTRELYWIPTVINMGDRGIIYPEGTTDNWKWKYAKVVDVPKESQKDYPIPGKDDEYYKTMLDVENAEEFENTEFLQACKAMGITTGDI